MTIGEYADYQTSVLKELQEVHVIHVVYGGIWGYMGVYHHQSVCNDMII